MSYEPWDSERQKSGILHSVEDIVRGNKHSKVTPSQCLALNMKTMLSAQWALEAKKQLEEQCSGGH